MRRAGSRPPEVRPTRAAVAWIVFSLAVGHALPASAAFRGHVVELPETVEFLEPVDAFVVIENAGRRPAPFLRFAGGPGIRVEKRVDGEWRLASRATHACGVPTIESFEIGEHRIYHTRLDDYIDAPGAYRVFIRDRFAVRCTDYRARHPTYRQTSAPCAPVYGDRPVEFTVSQMSEETREVFETLDVDPEALLAGQSPGTSFAFLHFLALHRSELRERFPNRLPTRLTYGPSDPEGLRGWLQSLPADARPPWASLRLARHLATLETFDEVAATRDLSPVARAYILHYRRERARHVP